MAFNVTGLTDYTQKATELLRAGILYNEDFSEFGLQTGIQKTADLNYVDANIDVQAYSCEPTAAGDSVFTRKEITVTHVQNVSKYCFNDLVAKALPIESEVERSLTQGLIDKLKQDTESKLWLGDDSLSINGWIDHITNAVGSPSEFINANFTDALTVDNVDNAVDAMIAAMSDEMVARGELTIYVSRAIFNLYKLNRMKANYYHDTQNKAVWEMPVFGYEGQVKIKAVTPLSGNANMFMTWSKNLIIGTDDVTEIAKAEWVEGPQPTDLMYFKAKYKIGTQIAFVSEVVVLDEAKL